MDSINCGKSYLAADKAKRFLYGCDHSRVRYALNLARQDLRILVGLLTGHADLNRHLHIMGLHQDSGWHYHTSYSISSYLFTDLVLNIIKYSSPYIYIVYDICQVKTPGPCHCGLVAVPPRSKVVRLLACEAKGPAFGTLLQLIFQTFFF